MPIVTTKTQRRPKMKKLTFLEVKKAAVACAVAQDATFGPVCP